jgi:hypothetical protein
MVKKILLALACLTLMTISSHAAATNIYISQNAAGAANEADCADAKPVSFFNTSGNWGSGSAQIGPGTTVHLCGTFTGGNGSTMLTIQGSGTSGSPVTILFESGAQLNAPYWGGNGAISCSGQNYITVDGGTNGIIQNTQDGSNLTYQAPTKGLYFSNCSNIEVRNLTVQNLYQRAPSDSTSAQLNTFGIYFDTGCDHLSVHNNTVQMMRGTIFIGYNTITDVQIYSNTLDYNSWSIVIGDDNNSSSASGIKIYSNTAGPHFQAWLDSGQMMHGDGVFLFAVNPGSTVTNSSVYDNYLHGDMCSQYGNCTSYIYLDGGLNAINVFNNVVVQETGGGPEANIRLNDDGNSMGSLGVYNNTVLGTNGSSFGVKSNTAVSVVLRNNIFTNLSAAIITDQSSTSMIQSNNNEFYGNTNAVCTNVVSSGNCYATLANWQSVSGQDMNSSTANPLLSSLMNLLTSSPAISLGTNLTNLGIAPLDSDKAGTARPSSGPWAAGAYQSGSGSAPAPPSSLTAIVQ